MVRKEKASKVHEDRHTSEHRAKDVLVKRDMLDPSSCVRRTEDFRGKVLSFGVLDRKQLDKWNDITAEGNKEACCSYASSCTSSVAETGASSLELDLLTGVVKRFELDFKPEAAVLNDSFSLISLDHQPVSRKQKEHKASLNKSFVKEEQSSASELSPCISPPCPLIFSRQTNPGSETSSKLLSEAFRTVECQDRRHEVHGKCSSPVSLVERNQISVEESRLLDHNIPNMTSKKGRHASPNRRFSFSFSQMSRSFSSKESSSSIPATSSTASHDSAKSGPLTFNHSGYTDHSIRTKPGGHSRTRSGPILKPKTEKNVPMKVALKPSNSRLPTMEKKQCSSRVHAILQFTLRKGINLYQFVVDDKHKNVLAATMKSSDSSTQSYTLYSVKEVKNKSSNWLGRHKSEQANHPFVHTIIGEMKTVTSFTSDLTTHKSESILLGVETNEEIAAIVQTRNMIHRQSTTTIILPSGVHTLPKDGNGPLPLVERWKSGGECCDCGGWDIGCELRVFSNDNTKCQSFSSFQLFDKERDEPAFKMVTHDDGLHSIEFGSTISDMEAFFISLAVSSHQSWCEKEEALAVLVEDGSLKRETSTKYASNPPVSPIGRV